MFTPAPTTANSVSFAAIDAYVEEQMRHLHIPGVSLAIVEGDRIVHFRGFGEAQPGGGPPTPQTPFLIGSLTKSITALAVMQLVEAGKIELDAPAQRYLPWFRVMDPQASAQMTVRHLLVQTSGLPASAGESILADIADSPDTAERQARALSSLVLAHPVGDTFEYSNSNYQLLGLIIEAVTGEAYADYVQNSILTPLRMNHSDYPDPTGAKNGLAMGHQYWFGRPVEAPDMPLPYGAMAAGLLISTAEDLAHYLIAHLNGGCYHDAQLLSPAGIAELHRGAAEFGVAGLGPIVGLLTKHMEMGQYGMGWNVNRIGRNELVWHGGTLPHFGAYMALLPERKIGLVLLFNACHHWLNPVLAEFGTGAGALLVGEKVKLPFTSVIRWLLPAQLLIPAFQIVDVAATLRRAKRWGSDSQRRPEAGQVGWPRVVFPLVLNAWGARLALRPLLSRRRGYLKLYMPDFSLIAAVCGGLALLGSFLRAGLVIRVLRKPLTRITES